MNKLLTLTAGSLVGFILSVYIVLITERFINTPIISFLFFGATFFLTLFKGESMFIYSAFFLLSGYALLFFSLL